MSRFKHDREFELVFEGQTTWEETPTVQRYTCLMQFAHRQTFVSIYVKNCQNTLDNHFIVSTFLIHGDILGLVPSHLEGVKILK